jgi:hypothetical protein
MPETKLQRLWRPSVAVVYLLTVIFDFILMPVYIEATNRVTIDYELIDRLDSLQNPNLQIEIARKMDVAKRVWAPLTLQGGGLLHLAFGSILTGAAITRGMEKKSAVESGLMHGENNPYATPHFDK